MTITALALTENALAAELNLGGLGSSLGWLLEVGKILSGLSDKIDIRKALEVLRLVPALLDDTPAWNSPGGAEGRVDEILAFAAQASLVSKTDVDDKLVTTATGILGNATLKPIVAALLRKLFEKKAAGAAGGGDGFSFDVQAEALESFDPEPFTAAGFDPAAVLKFIQLLFQVIEYLSALFGGK